MSRFSGLRAAALGLVVALVASGCVPMSGVVDDDPYSAENIAYGRAPHPAAGVALQPDVVLVAGGGASVRGVSADGFTWILDPDAPGADDLGVGVVMFVTERGVGRVIDSRIIEDDLVVTIAPVEITEVIRDGDFAVDTPVALERAIALDTEGAFWADPAVLDEHGVGEDDVPFGSTPPEDVTGIESSSAGAGDASAALWRPSVEPMASIPGPPGLPRPPMPKPKVADVNKALSGAFDITGTCCSGGVGTTFSYDKDGVRLQGALKLAMDSPKASFDLQIKGGTVKVAELKLSGAGSVHTEITAATRPGPAVNRASQKLGMNVDFSVPVATVLGIPFSITVSQEFKVAIAIPGTATLTGKGDYKLGGSLALGYRDGKLGSSTTGGFEAASSVAGTSSIAVGISSVTLDYSVTFRLGIGAFGFTAGLDLGVKTQSTLSVGAPIGFNTAPDAQAPIMQCKRATGQAYLSYGFGYSIPTPIADVVNYFLSFFKTEPIQAHGGQHRFKPLGSAKTIVHPDSGLCR
jgi:hypothetical protein